MAKYFSRISLSFITFTLLLLMAECGLRMNGVKPGFKGSSKFFKRVDSLRTLGVFYGDSNGVLCISQDARQFLCNALGKGKPKKVASDDAQSHDIYSLANHFLEVRKKNYQSDFKSFLEKIEAEDKSPDKIFSDAIKNYANCPINSNGFKSIAFSQYNSALKSILLLGDSFTWGHSASNMTNCFADLLLAKGYCVYNTGISGVDPPQYLQLAKMLIPKLEPDYVIVNFYMGNDIQYFERKLRPFMPILYATNAGNLISCPEGVYFETPQDAYEFSLAEVTIPPTNSYNRFCSATAITTLFWRACNTEETYAINLPQYADYLKKVEQAKMETPYSNIVIEQIKALSEKYNSKFILVVIPKLEDSRFIFPESNPELFEGLKYFVPPVELSHYHQFTDGHYNDFGHKMHAEFIDSLIKNIPPVQP